MTNLEILQLALIGAKTRLRDAASIYAATRSSNVDKAIEDIRTALIEYVEVSELIEKCEKEK